MAGHPHRSHQPHAALLREFGVIAPAGSQRFLADLHPLLDQREEQLPARVRRTVWILGRGRDLEHRIETLEEELAAIVEQEPVLQSLMQIPGIGLLTATTLFATVANIHAFRNGRQLACWLGLTPREHSSGSRRRLGRMSKQGDAYVRTLVIHGARAALNGARRTEAAGRPLTELQAWALKRARESHHNKAAVALANKVVRIAWAVWHHDRVFDGNHVVRLGA